MAKSLVFSGSSVDRESACHTGDATGSIPASSRSSGGQSNPLQYSCLGESYGQRSLAGYSPQGHTESDMTEVTQHTSTSCIVGCLAVPLASTHQCQGFLCPSVATRNVSRHGQVFSGEGKLSLCRAPGVQIQPLKQNCHQVETELVTNTQAWDTIWYSHYED